MVRAGGGATPTLGPSWTRTRPRCQNWRRRRRSAVSPGAGDYLGPGLPLQPAPQTIDAAPRRSTRTAQAAAAPLETSVTGAELKTNPAAQIKTGAQNRSAALTGYVELEIDRTQQRTPKHKQSEDTG
ncbi:hypothetical protein NDU88_005416 [Pleurodeles waltl]|uniref:Uncharacterized protein n=1 Tax=Pleurodeles waltl TaxID=8319 RepID=A0AAV7MC17_PLEWA|nr:hypothetical protein NDU88_005416 [Pleurodeles waltl]